MTITYNNNKLEKSVSDLKNINKNYGKITGKKILERLDILESADNLLIINEIEVLRLHKLGGNKKNQWSIDLHQNWRLLFEITHDPIPMLENDEGGNDGFDFLAITSIEITSIEDTH